MTYKAKRAMAEKLAKLLDENAMAYVTNMVDFATFSGRQGGIWDSVIAIGLLDEVQALIRHLEQKASAA